MKMLMTKRYARRYKRTAPAKPIIIRPDDLEIFWHLYRHRLMDQEMIRSLFPGRSPKKLTLRMRDLYDAEFIDRIDRTGLPPREGGGSWPELIALGREGAKALQDTGLSINPRYWRDNNARLKRRNVHHLLQVTQFMVALELSQRANEGISLIRHDEIIGATQRDLGHRQGLPTNLRAKIDWHDHSGVEGTASDAIFGVKVHGHERPYRYFFYEEDAGSETIEKKMIVYAFAFTSRAHEKKYGMGAFRVLTRTTSPDRIAKMQQAFERHVATLHRRVPSGLFLFTHHAQTETAEDLLSMPFVDAAGKETFILE
jgi:hypothetical protein